MEREREHLKTIKIDPGRTIRKIGMIVNEDEQLIALRLIDEKGLYIVNVTWMTKDNQSTDWITRTLPGGQDIIGLRCKYGAKNEIKSLGFMTWQPKVERDKTKSLQSKESFLFRKSPSISSPNPIFK